MWRLSSLSIGIVALVFGVPFSSVARQPNVIIILADDLGFGDLSCYGHPKFKTPRLDQMAAEGIRMMQFNTPMPFCAPTRAALLTGRYPLRNGMNLNPTPDSGPKADSLALSSSEILLPELFRSAGYATSMVGKWHLGHQSTDMFPTHRGFDEYFGILYSNDMRPVQLFEGDEVVEDPVVQSSLTERYTARCLQFIERQRDKPFFLYLAHAIPHKPLATSRTFDGKSDGGLYGDVMAELDASVGRVLDALKQSRIDEQTLVVFTSDNGPWFGGSSGGLRGMKATSWEGGYRVPLIARWPGKIKPGQKPQGLVGLGVMPDVFTTAMTAAEIKLPTDRIYDGVDLMPLWTGKSQSVRDLVYGQIGDQLATVRDPQWKLHVVKPNDRIPAQPWVDPRAPDEKTILAPAGQYQPKDYPGLMSGVVARKMMLFDLSNDPGEQVDLAATNPDRVSRLKNEYDRFQLSAGTRIESVIKVWDQGKHNAFTDLIRWRDRWYCTFREADAHVGGDGGLRILASSDGVAWESVALLQEQGIDLRDPKLSTTPDDRLMIVAGGSVYQGKNLLGRQPRVAFSTDAKTWTATQRVLDEGDWLWRVTWRQGKCYGVCYDASKRTTVEAKQAAESGKASAGPAEWKLRLVVSDNGSDYKLVTHLDVPGHPNETTLRFLPDGEMVAMVRREGGNTLGWIGRSLAPYTEWTWQETGHRMGGPNFVVLDDGRMIAGSRNYPGGAKFSLYSMTAAGEYSPIANFPSNGDCSYPGMVFHAGRLWVSYYSSHEGKSAIYLGTVQLPKVN